MGAVAKETSEPAAPAASRPLRLWQRPWPVALLIGALAELLFLFRLTTPHKLMFDETHYVPAARALIALSGPVNIEHPLVGKELIAAGILIFGDNSLGWRIFATIAGTATVMALFAILQLVHRRLRTSVIGAVLSVLTFTLFIQARIGMLDVFEAAFLTTGVAALFWSMTSPAPRVTPRWILGSALLGLAVGAKWAAVPFVAYTAILFLSVRMRDAARAGPEGGGTFEIADGPLWPGLDAASALAWLGVVSLGVYLLTFLPAFCYAREPLTLASLLPFQARMYAEQTQVLATHPYQSQWWSWPFDIRPIWYLYEQIDGAWRGVLMVGNPLIWWGGLIAAAVTIWKWAMGGPARELILTGLWLGAFLPFAIIPKSLGFMHYYFPASMFLAGVLAVALSRGRSRRFWQRDTVFVAGAAAVFLYFYPILSASALPEAQSFRQWMMLPTWP